MKTVTRTAALALGLTLAGGLSIGGSSAQAQVPNRPAPAPSNGVVRTAPAYTPFARGYVPAARSYQHTSGYFLPSRNGAVYSRHYGYEPARRDNKLYKPWLSRD